MLADLNVDPLESDGKDQMPTPNPNPNLNAAAAIRVVAIDFSPRSSNEETGSAKIVIATKETDTVECEDADQHCQGASVPREEKLAI
ncbi:hypothetical protein GUJ93_ZPchr0001g32918 [Zizania palustris]|uniref:Uncharacterized protein n=1 Tax=Zizania palustris TaxID=103762 RepID=A0A8J5RA71_ZIZPA|nr:hypothetical protein GUJ93_ZPchr0001g32918 [Zizania palustris]